MMVWEAGAFNGDLSTWQVGEVINMANSTYILSPPSPRSGLVLAVSFSLLFPFFLSSEPTNYICLNPLLALFFFSKCFTKAVSNEPYAVANGH